MVLRTRIRIDRATYFLAQDQNVDEVLARMTEAVRSGGDFVAFTEVGNRSVRLLLSPGIPVLVEQGEIEADERDTGDLDAPFLPDLDARHSFLDGYFPYDY